ncbi:DUF2750 domain-containing protein [Thiorhodococcus mannitoliphagus]|uniref:DUF2750 domain-containing protein n=1 Tax=Thiorhodococcus mannitoliphagus TaxID=329406 RepID=A0A6P1DUW8_9GAMM|nr:DUF2750 domain-containing protein [Thiorhodococcus mannitoliphagus]NEX22137.1 DUF2750 domain-containing protein [Thiorhodococcus mannitoliphagus]
MNAPQSTQATAALFDLPADDRYAYFVSEITGKGKVWTLEGSGGFVAFCDEDGRQCFPFWPAPELAEALANADWSDCRAEALDLEVFMNRWLKGMAKDNRLVSVFPALDGTGIVVDPLELLDDLQAELG